MGLQTAFECYIKERELFTRDDRILLTVSGGVDSMVMLTLFSRSGYQVGVAHCNFQLRGTESEEDEALVAAKAAELGLPFYNRRFETLAEMERTGESMEMVARRLRYAWFEELCRTQGYSVIALAHHADDSIETFFINLLRGTGLRGLTGISNQIGRLVRPLMFATRKEILEFAVANHIPFREDSSNRSTKYLRNKVRLGLVPRIREINPKFTALMQRNLQRLTDAQLFINSCMQHIRNEVVTTSPEGVDTIHLDRLSAELPRAFVIYELLNSGYGFKGDVVDSLTASLDRQATGRRFYARDHVACIDRGNIVIAPIAPDDACTVEVPAMAHRSYCGNAVLYYEWLDIDTIRETNVPENVALIDADLLQFPMRLRRWQEGDAFVPFGMTGRKKLSDFLKDEKVSVAEKQRQFLLLSGEEIVWVVGRRISDRYRLTDKTERVLRITKEII